VSRGGRRWPWVAWVSALVVATGLAVLPLVYRPDPFGPNQAPASKDSVVLDDPLLEFVTSVPAGFVVVPHVEKPNTRLLLVAEAWLPNTAKISIVATDLQSDTTGMTDQQLRDVVVKQKPGGHSPAPEAEEARTADGRPALPVTRGTSDQDERILRFAVPRGRTMYVITSDPPDPATAGQLAGTRQALTTVVTTLRFRSG